MKVDNKGGEMKATIFFAVCVVLFLAFQNCQQNGITTLSMSGLDADRTELNLGSQSRYPDDVALVIDPSQYFKGTRFSYAPSAIKNPGSDLLHIYTCHNLANDVFDDSIFYTQVVPQKTGNFTVKSTGSFFDGNRPADWNACDPTIVQGNYSYRGKDYDFAIFYTAMPLERFNVIDKLLSPNLSEYNEVRLVLFNSIRGEKTYYGSFFSFPRHPDDTSAYGFGQPSAINLDRKGKILLFYSYGRIGKTVTEWQTKYRVLDISNLDSPVVGSEKVLSSAGIAAITNGDFAIGANNRLYVITEDPASFVNNVKVATGLRLLSTSFDPSAFESGLQNASWTLEKSIQQSMTGESLNHNAGFIRNGFGYLDDLSNVGVILTGGDRNAREIAWTYSLHAAYFTLEARATPSICTNGATNYPTCSTCTSDKYYNGSSCVPSGTTPGISFVGPSNPSATASTNPNFSWSAATGHDRYILDVSTSSSFAVGSFANCEVSAAATSYSWYSCYSRPLSVPAGFGSGLNVGTTYYWRIVAFKGSEAKSSAVASFQLSAQQPSGPVDYTFSWSSYAGAQVYWIDISQYPDFRWFWNCDSTSTSVKWSTCKNKNYSGVNNPPTMPSSPQAGVTYYYRVVPFVNGAIQGIIKSGSFLN